MAEENTLVRRILEAFSLKAPAAREEAVMELLKMVDLTPESNAPEIDALIEGLRKENSNEVQTVIWGHLAQFPQYKLRSFAESELGNANGSRRQWAVEYLGRAYPAETNNLYERMKRDLDPFVLHELGKVMVSSNPHAAVRIWDLAMSNAPQGLADEVLPALIGQYADPEFLDELRKKAERPFDDLSRIALWQAENWNAVDYLDAKKPVDVGSGYFIQCPHCQRQLGVRDGNEGERARCKWCGQEFIVPPRTARK